MPTRIAFSTVFVLFVGHQSSLNPNEETFVESKFRLYWTGSHARYRWIADILPTASVQRKEALWWVPAGFHANLFLWASIFNIIASLSTFQRSGNDWTTKNYVISSFSLGNLTLRWAVGILPNVWVHQEHGRPGCRFVDIYVFKRKETNLLVTEALASDLWSLTRKNQISSRPIRSYLRSNERKRLSSRLNTFQNLLASLSSDSASTLHLTGGSKEKCFSAWQTKKINRWKESGLQ